VLDELNHIQDKASGGPEVYEEVPSHEPSRLHFYSDYNEGLYQRRPIPEQVDICILRG